MTSAKHSTEDTGEEKAPKPDKFNKLIEALNLLMSDKFTGFIKVNFSQGSIGRVEKSEEVNE